MWEVGDRRMVDVARREGKEGRSKNEWGRNYGANGERRGKRGEEKK